MKTILQKHRNLFNGDTAVFFYNPEMWQPEGGAYSAKAIHRYVENLARSGIDTFLINANASRAWYPSKVIPTVLDGYQRGDREYFRGHVASQPGQTPEDVERGIDVNVAFFALYQDLLDAGVDWLAEAATACRQRDVSPWVSLRMNDFHGHRNLTGSFINLPLLAQPEMRLQRSEYSPTMDDPSYRRALNYERAEVRALMFAQIREVVEDYDFEGLELDWWRNPLCCEPNSSQETISMMTAWFREIRALTDRRARITGRPFYFGMRIPGRLETLKSIGIDIVTLCREGTLDFINPSHFWCTAWDMPHDEIRRQVGDQVAIYGVIEDGANGLPTYAPGINKTMEIRYISASQEMLRANAAGKLVLGADGIEWFNFYCTDQSRIPGLISNYSFLRDMPHLDKLRGEEKHYTFSTKGGEMPHIPFESAAQLPVILRAGWQHSFRLPMCAEPSDTSLELVVQVVLKATDKFTYLPISVNACWPKLEYKRSDKTLFPCGPLTDHVKENTAYDFVFPVSLLRDGWNEFTVENGGNELIEIVCLEVAIRRRNEK